MSKNAHELGLSLVIGIVLSLLILAVLQIITLELIVAVAVAYKYHDAVTFYVMKLYNKHLNKEEKPNGY